MTAKISLPISTERCEPEWFEGIPCCSESCASFDGKRCELLGFRPGRICEPAVREVVARAAENAPNPVDRIVRGDRGFIGYGGPVNCVYGTAVEVYESSSAEGPHVWLALKQGPALMRDAALGVAHAHLSPGQAAAVITRLQAFLNDIPERWGKPEEGDDDDEG